MKRNICFVTGTRAEYGLLVPLMRLVEKEESFRLQLVATAMHLSPEFGLTYRQIEADGFSIDSRVEMLLSSDTPTGAAKSAGLGIIGFADAFRQLRPDLLVLLGDRYEVLAAAQTALIAGIPTAHIAGGDSTEGAFDEAIRHSVTKMSHLHFVTNEQSRRRVIQLGENPEHVYCVGSPAADRIGELALLNRPRLEETLDFRLLDRNLLITFHPVTLEPRASARQFRELLEALEELGEGTGLIFTKPGADPESREIAQLQEAFVQKHPNAAVFTSLGQPAYFSLLAQVDALVGNSSSGIYEAPFFSKPSVNIGDRQKGRLMASSVLCSPPVRERIKEAIEQAFQLDCTAVNNPYGGKGCAEKILAVIRSIEDFQALRKKHFYDLEEIQVSHG